MYEEACLKPTLSPLVRKFVYTLTVWCIEFRPGAGGVICILYAGDKFVRYMFFFCSRMCRAWKLTGELSSDGWQPYVNPSQRSTWCLFILIHSTMICHIIYSYSQLFNLTAAASAARFINACVRGRLVTDCRNCQVMCIQLLYVIRATCSVAGSSHLVAHVSTRSTLDAYKCMCICVCGLVSSFYHSFHFDALAATCKQIGCAF